jgi:hypothetical protein
MKRAILAASLVASFMFVGCQFGSPEYPYSGSKVQPTTKPVSRPTTINRTALTAQQRELVSRLARQRGY